MAFSFGGQTFGGSPRGSFGGHPYGGWSGGLSIDRGGGREPSFFTPRGAGFGGYPGAPAPRGFSWRRTGYDIWRNVPTYTIVRNPRAAPASRYTAAQKRAIRALGMAKLAKGKPLSAKQRAVLGLPHIDNAGVAGVLAARFQAKLNANQRRLDPHQYSINQRRIVHAQALVPLHRQDVALHRVNPINPSRQRGSGIARAAANTRLGKPTRSRRT